MATTNEKPKKGFMSNYKLGNAGKYRFQLPESKQPVEKEKSFMSRSWLMRKPKVVSQEVENKGEIGIEENGGRGGGGSGSGGGEMGFVEARRSVSHVETNLASVVSFLQVRVLVADMPSFMQVHAFRCARRTYDSLEKFSAKHMAYNIKKEFDKVHGPAWHCIVGSSFGSFVTHSTGCFLYFSMDKLYILMFRTKIQKAAD